MAVRSLLLALVGLMVITPACGGSNDDRSQATTEKTPANLLGPDAFAARIARPEATVINVHVPYEGEIEGTDAFIPFDNIAGDQRLPADKGAEIVLYCRSGRMSQTAAKTLAAAGYTNLYDLEGGCSPGRRRESRSFTDRRNLAVVDRRGLRKMGNVGPLRQEKNKTFRSG